MKIRRKGRTYDDTPTVHVEDGEGHRDNYSIAPVMIRCYFHGHEHFLNSRKLMDYLDGMTGTICDMAIGGETIPGNYIDALDNYLEAGRGLQSFRRDRVTWHSRADLVSLLSQVGFPSHYVTRLQPPNQVPAGLTHPPRAPEDCDAPQYRRKWFLGK